jgi:DNA repair protein RadC
MSDKSNDQLGHRKRLRDRYFSAGIGAFAPHEVVELLLTLAVPRRDVKPLAKLLLAKFGSLRSIMDAGKNELMEVEGVSEATAFAIQFLRSLIPAYLQPVVSETSIKDKPELLEQLWTARLGHENGEVFEVAYFDAGLRLLRDGIATHSRGTADRSAVFPGEVIKEALKRNAYAIAFAHNHPSGDPAPSDADKLLTKQLVLAATAVNIRVVDHLIIASGGTFSFRQAGLL